MEKKSLMASELVKIISDYIVAHGDIEVGIHDASTDNLLSLTAANVVGVAGNSKAIIMSGNNGRYLNYRPR